MPTLILLFMINYLIGSIPFGYLIGKFKGVDIRKVGSGNIGATNVYRSCGVIAYILTLSLDILKGAIAVIIIKYYTQNNSLFPIIGGMMAVVGHTYSPWLKFKGGKGVATAAGVFIILSTIPTLLAATIFTIIAVITRYISLGSIVAVICLPLLVYFLQKDINITIFSLLLAIVIIIKHRANIRRLIQKKEYKFRREITT